jgi:hypothetical protein
VIGTLVCCAALLASRSDLPPVETLIRLTVDPMPAPKPALRYLLLPELKEMTPGNPVPNYLKCLLDQDYSTAEENLSRAALRQADRAARMDKPDWQILPKLRTDGIGLLLPDLQKMRLLAAGLQARFRDEVALRRFDEALVTAKTMFALSRHLGEHPTLIGDLVGMAIAFIAIGPLEEMLEQPGCPNLYWALTNLPSPLVSMEKGFEGERIFILAELRDLDDKNPMTPEQIKKLVAYIDKLRAFEPDKLKKTTREFLDERTKDAKYMAAARARLVEYGTAEDRLARFPADQVILLDERVWYEVERDEAIKFTNLPTWEAADLIAKFQPNKEPRLFTGFVPAIQKVRLAQGRLEQRIALLRHVEALRMYAAAHAGNLPEKLTEVDVPLPADPFTGKPFRYELKDGTAHLRGSPPKGYEQHAAFNLHYEIMVRK